jgi:cobalt-zinc-cadmium efflux system protein
MPHKHDHDTTRNIGVAFVLNFSFAIFELAGGIWTNSLAITSDAIHDLGDSLSLALAWYLERYAGRGGDSRFSYGYRRFSLLGALINTVILLLGSVYILSEAIPRLINPEPTNAQGMIIFAVVGIAVNGMAALRLRGTDSMNARVVSLHLLEDVFGWIAVLIVSLVLLFTDLYILDPLLSILITLFILYNVIRNLRKTLALFLQGVPDNLNLLAIQDQILSIEEVQSTHNTHVWSLDGVHHVLSSHIVLADNVSKDDLICVREKIKEKLRQFDLSHSTIEIEFGDNDCMIMTD